MRRPAGKGSRRRARSGRGGAPAGPVGRALARASLRESGVRGERGGRKLSVGVVWSDVTRVKADVLIVGHYLGVLPQAAELAVDRMLSAGRGEGKRRLVLTELTRRGALRGELGELLFFPAPDRRVAAIAGMGRLGTFRAPQLERLGRTVGQVVGMLPRLGTVASVLIGSGKGNLGVTEAVRAYLDGLAEALAGDPALELGRFVFVESHLDRAIEILRAVRAHASERNGRRPHLPAIRLAARRALVEGPGGSISQDFGCAMVLAALAQAEGTSKRSAVNGALEAVLTELPASVRDLVRTRMRKRLPGDSAAPRASALRDLAMQFRLREPDEEKGDDEAIPSRVAFWRVDGDVHGAAITNTSTVTERAIPKRAWLIEQACERLHNPKPEKLEEWARALRRLLVPPELGEVLSRDGPLVVELDRTLARVQWEALPGSDGVPLGMSRPIARQLRTAYSPRPIEPDGRRTLTALVIGEPTRFDPALTGVHEEAKAVAAFLSERGVQTELMIGAPEPGTGAGIIERVPPADYLAVVDQLLSGRFDIVHYCGHATFDPEVPGRAGWVFDGGRLLTAHELEGMERPPPFVFANACLSAQIAPLPTGAGTLVRESNLVAGLADELFRRGVCDYVGTAWEVDSDSAKAFATHFYDAVLRPEPQASTIGAALQSARKALYEGREKSNAWAAYQHYGDPARRIALPATAP